MEKIEDIKTNENENSVTNQEKRREYDISHIDKEHNTSKIISKHELDRKKSKYLPINFGPINKNNYNQLKQLNNMTLPVRYMDGFYFRIIHGLRYGRFAYYNDLIVGAIS